MLAARAVLELGCDLLLLQEPGPPAAADLRHDLGEEYRVEVRPCDPSRWDGGEEEEDGAKGRQGQEYDGNGFVWRPDRLELLDGGPRPFYLSSTPWRAGGNLWDGSPYVRTGVEARFRDRRTGLVWAAVTAHFDHVGSGARRESARIVMELAKAALAGDSEGTKADEAVVGGDFNTFPTAAGRDTYDALALEAEGAGLADVRALPGTTVVDFGASGHTWRGWEGRSRHCRSENVALHGARLGQDASRLDHVFATRGAEVRWTGVVEGAGWAEASDHAPIVVEFGCGSGAEDGAS